jgi:MFS superfamily sulfate permease-like transporter
VLVLDCGAIFDVEYSAMKMLAEAEQRARRQGGELWLAALNPAVKAVLRRAPVGRSLGAERMFDDVEHAVGWFRAGAGGTGPGAPGQNASPAPK